MRSKSLEDRFSDLGIVLPAPEARISRGACPETARKYGVASSDINEIKAMSETKTALRETALFFERIWGSQALDWIELWNADAAREIMDELTRTIHACAEAVKQEAERAARSVPPKVAAPPPPLSRPGRPAQIL
jgi:hypothetical protein